MCGAPCLFQKHDEGFENLSTEPSTYLYDVLVASVCEFTASAFPFVYFALFFEPAGRPLRFFVT